MYRCAYLADEFEYVAEGKEYDEDDEERSQHLGRLLMISPLPATHTTQHAHTTHCTADTQTTRQQLMISPLPATHTTQHTLHCTADTTASAHVRLTSSETAATELDTARLSDSASTQTFCTEKRPENRLKIQ